MRTTFRSIAPPSAVPAEPDMLAAASAIGERLVREAVWHRGHCNWVGVSAGAANSAGRHRPVHRALGPELGGGSAGIALFLAQLYAATGDDRVRATALGAVGRSLAHAGDVPAPAARGLYEGRLGVAYGAARCGLLLADERLARRAARLARERHPRDGGTPASDVVAGTAGAIVALLALARLLDDDRLAGRADALGDELAHAARRERHGWSWPAPGPRPAHGLCGIAHGASGPAWALLELFAVTGEPRHRDAAERALDYERRWLDATAGDWPDLRGVLRRERRGSFRALFTPTWSHGAPGIALARLRAWEILGDERHRAEATIALAATAASVERALPAHDSDFTLAHGLAGRADVLALGARSLPGAAPEHAPLARQVGEIGIGRYAAAVDGWPCGMPGAGSPALLTGHAGIGLFYLRLHAPTVPSALLIGVPAP